jgi:hypothetical protein
VAKLHLAVQVVEVQELEAELHSESLELRLEAMLVQLH